MLAFGILILSLWAGAMVLLLVVSASLSRRHQETSLLWLLSVTVERGLPIADELEAYAAGCSSRFDTYHRMRIRELARRLRNGELLGDALSAVPALISEPGLTLVRMGERLGQTEAGLRTAVQRFERLPVSIREGRSPGLHFYYLVGLPLGMLILLSGLIIFIIPKYKKIFDDFGSEFPWVTTQLVDVSAWFANYWYLLALPILAYFGWRSIRFWRGTSSHWGLTARSRSPVLLYIFAMAVRDGRPLGTVLDALSERFGLSNLRRLNAGHGDGASIWRSLVSTRYLSTKEAELLVAAEGAGNLPWALTHLADGIEERRLLRRMAVAELVQPAVVIVAGLVVLFVALGMFLPLVQLLSDLS